MPSQPQFRNQLTRLGIHFALLGSFAVFGGAIRGFNLLLVLAALLIGALLMHWRWARRSLAALNVQRRLPRETIAGVPFTVQICVTNQHRFLTAWMLRMTDRIERVGGHEETSAGCGLAAISAGQTESADYDCLITRRGRYRFGLIQMETAFPFALFRCRTTIDSSNEICVLPKLLKLSRHVHSDLYNCVGVDAATARRRGSAEGEFFGLRKWQHGDSLKWIHWRTTARLNEPAVRQFEQQRRVDLCLIVDAFAWSESDWQTAELAISLAATLIAKSVLLPGSRIVLAVAGDRASAIVGGGSGSGRRRMLVSLAEAKVSPQPKLSKAIHQCLALAGSAGSLLIVSSRSQAEAMATTEAIRQFPAVSASRSRIRWIDVRELDLVATPAGESA